MTLIVGTLRTSGGLFNGRLRYKLSAPLVDIGTTPDTVRIPIEDIYQIENGVVSLDVQESETAQITYEFTLETAETVTDYFFEDGLPYTGPAHLHSDTFYYTGTFHGAGSVRLARVVSTAYNFNKGFFAIVRAASTVEFSELLPTGVTTDRLIQGARQIASLLVSDAIYQDAIGEAILSYQGAYNPATFYRRRNWVTYAGGSWYSDFASPHQGNTPTNGSLYWVEMARQGAAGVGVTGQDTAFDPTGWNGATWVPTANALRDYLVLLAPLISPALGGTPTCPTPANPSNDLTVINSAWARILLTNSLTNTVLAGNPTIPTTPPFTESDTRGVNAGWVKGVYHRYSRVADRKASGVSGGSSVAGFNTRVLQTIGVNAGDIISLTANVVTLRPGTYRFAAQAPCSNGLSHRLELVNSTSGVIVANQINILSYAAIAAITTATASGIFTIAANTAFTLRHNIGVAVSVSGLGLAMSAGTDEVYAVIEFWRID